MSDNKSPFNDLVVIELATVLAGPAVGLFFAELGATVIKIENPVTNGDVTRSWKHTSENIESKKSAYYHSVNWNKQVHYLNAKQPEDYNSTLELIQKADIVIANFKFGSAAKLRLDYPTLKEKFPQLIYASISAYGNDDNRPGFDALLQAETGWMHMNGQAQGPPTKMPVALIDILAAHQLKEGILVALLNKLKSGKGTHVSVSLYDTAIASLANQASNYLNLDVIPQRKGSQHPNIAPYGDIFKTKDGKQILLAVGNEKQFKNLCDILSVSNLISDSKFQTNTARVQHRKLLNDELELAIQTMTYREILDKASKASVPMGGIRDLEEVFKDKKTERLILTQEESDKSISKRVRTCIFKLSE